jgi:diacylglycerol kinase family enzyme
VKRSLEIVLQTQLVNAPCVDLSAPLIFVVNVAAGSQQAALLRATIESSLVAAGRLGEIVLASPTNLNDVAHSASLKASKTQTAVIAVGGDGTISAVSQAAHSYGCVIGVIPMGTFNYFARANAISLDILQAMQIVLHSSTKPVQVATINQQVFLVNASLGLYPTLLEDREIYKARFGRSRIVALGAAFVTLLRAHRQLRLHIELGSAVHNVRTTTLFVGNNRLQLEQVGVQVSVRMVGALAGGDSANNSGRVAAVMLRPAGTMGMAVLMLRSAIGTLGEADTVESFEFEHMVVKPRLNLGRRKVKVALDGEVTWMRWPINFEVSEKPLYLLRPDTATPFNFI